jgi:hypothetical protein
MIAQVLFVIGVLALVVATTLALIFLAWYEMRRERRISGLEKTLWTSLGVVLVAPVVFVLSLLGWFAAANFPFTSGLIAEAAAPNGEQACVVQTFKSAEPYQVSIYIRQAGGPWTWHYLAHQDTRWRRCRIEFEGDALRVYTGSALRKTFSLAEASLQPRNAGHDLPANFTPAQIAAQHNQYFREHL